MATGDQNDFAARLAAVLPSRWLPAGAPIITGLLTGFGAAWAAIYSQITYTRLQARVATATGPWLDGISTDFNAGMLPRLVNESDAAFSARIRANFFAPANTRAAVIQALLALTGRTPSIFEPRNTQDTGGYNKAMGYGVAGGYGCLSLPFSFFVTAYRPVGGGIANVNGYGGYLGGYGVGAQEYGSLSLVLGQVTDASIQQAVARVTPAGTTAWMNISN